MTKYPDLITRALTATVGAAIIVVGIVFGPWSYFGVFLGISLLTQWEFYRLVGNGSSRPLTIWGTLLGTGIVALSYLSIISVVPFYWLLFLAPVGFVIFISKLYQKEESQAFVGIANTWLGVVYVALPFSLMHVIAFAPGYYDFELVLGCLLLHWAHDVGAYFTGVKFGRTKLFERWSPKKTWEGSAGGAALALLTAVIGSHWAHSLELWEWLVMAAIIVIAGTFGDLVESQFKRIIAVKDSGRSIPGHGGFLDRFDGLLLSTPIIAAFLKLIFS